MLAAGISRPPKTLSGELTLARLILVLSLVLSFACAALGADTDWKLVFRDDFERTEIGSDWREVEGASIVNGRMRLVGTVNARISRGFKPDIRLEFDGWALDGVPPCDMSATLCGGEDVGWGYLLGFGARWNHANHLVGPGVSFADLKPPFVIEHGKKYHCVAQKEGKQISYTVNGRKLFDVRTEDPIGGPGFDLAGVITWTGMEVDNVRVYERVAPHPDSPKILQSLPDGPLYREGRNLRIRETAAESDLQRAVQAFNDGKMFDALRLFRNMGSSLVGLLGQGYVLGDLAYVERFKNPEFERLAGEFRTASKARPDDKVLADYALLAGWFARLKMRRSSEAMVSAIRIRALGPNNNPFYYKARLYQARYTYWNGKEGGDWKTIAKAVDWMKDLKALWPENSILRQYTGEPVPWGEELTADTQRHPAWAAYLREAYARNIAIMQRFFDERQAPDGQLGGGYGDDCELMRTWMQIAAISSASEKVRAGIQRLAQGIWDNVLRDGFDKGMSDVEHSAEPSADTLPGMLLLRYGDPLWVERNMRSCKTIKETYMAIDANGYPRFRSSVYGGGEIETTVMGGGDTGYNARAMKHFIWQAWQGNTEARDWFVRWADGWRAATMSQIGSKIPGVVPPTIWYPSGSIFPPVKGATWHDEKLNYCTRGDMIVDVFLAAYYFTGDRKFLSPYTLGMYMGSRGPLPKDKHPEGSKEWQMDNMIGYSGNMPTEQCKTALYRWLTGDTVYDDFTLRYGDAVHRYRIDGDLDAYLKSFQKAAEGLRHDLELQTTEVLSTDRAALGSALSIFGAYTGAVTGMRDAATPTFAVTYDTPTTDFAALVLHSSTERVRVWLYNFDEKPMPVGLKLWRLRPGSYILNQGEQVAGEAPGIRRYAWEKPTTVKITHRADGPTVTVPPGRVWAVDLRLEQPISVPKSAPDLAIGPNDVVQSGNRISVTVHNVGSAASGPFTVRLQRKAGQTWKAVSSRNVSPLAPPRNLAPSSTAVTFSAVGGPPLRVQVIQAGGEYELCETNNAVVLSAAGP